MPTDLTYVPDYKHLFEANAVLARRRYSLGQRVSVNLAFFVSMVAGGVLAGVGGTVVHRLLPAMPEWIIVIALLALVLLFFWKVLLPWQHRRSAQFVNTARPHGPMRFSADDKGMRWQDADIDFKLHWSGVEAIYATPSSIAFMSGIIGLVLPLSAFKDGASRRTFLADALARIPAAAAEKSRADAPLVALL